MLAGDDAVWLVDELHAGDEASAALARRLEDAGANAEPISLSSGETRQLVRILERSTRPRTRELRELEIALHDQLFQGR
jgi:hypothetical protein